MAPAATWALVRIRPCPFSEARIAAADARKLIAQNVDPLDARAASRKAAKPIPTFEEIAKIMIDEAQHKSTNAKVRYQ